MQRAYLGIDVGAKGFLTLNTGTELKFYSISDNDYYKLSDIMSQIKADYPDVVCAMEEIHAIYGSSAKATLMLARQNQELQTNLGSAMCI